MEMNILHASSSLQLIPRWRLHSSGASDYYLPPASLHLDVAYSYSEYEDYIFGIFETSNGISQEYLDIRYSSMSMVAAGIFFIVVLDLYFIWQHIFPAQILQWYVFLCGGINEFQSPFS
jgi:hypothetical protein